MDKQKTHIVKSNGLIDSSYKLTLAETRLINIACKKLKPKFVERNISLSELDKLVMANMFGEMEISIPEYKDEFNIKSNSIYKELKSVAESLYEKGIEYFDEEGSLVKKRWVITCKYNDKTKKVVIRLHPDLMLDLMVVRSNYTKLNYSFMTTVKSFYASRLYELLRQYLRIGQRTFDLNDLRFRFALLDSEYPLYSNLKQKVLKPSIKWINDNSDIQVIMSEDKVGRSVKRLKFDIKPKYAEQETPKSVIEEQMSMDDFSGNSVYHIISSILGMELTAQNVNSISDAAIEGLKNNNLNEVKILDYIKEKWEFTKKSNDIKPIESPIGFLIVALKKNWVFTELDVNKHGNYTGNNSKRLKQNKDYNQHLNSDEYTDEEIFGWLNSYGDDEAAIGIED